MQLKPLGENQTQLETKKDVVFYSYETPVAANIGGKFYRTSSKFSVTTTKHINSWLNGRDAEEKEQSFFDSLV